MPKPCMPIRKSRMASGVRKKALKMGPSMPKFCDQRGVPSRTASGEIAPHRVERLIGITHIAAHRMRAALVEIGLRDGRVFVDAAALVKQLKRGAAIQQAGERFRLRAELRGKRLRRRGAGVERIEDAHRERGEHRLGVAERLDQVEDGRGIGEVGVIGCAGDRNREREAARHRAGRLRGFPLRMVPIRVRGSP